MTALEAELMRLVGELTPAKRIEGRALHRPFLLLWAVGKAVQGEVREHRWSTVRDAVGPLMTTHLDVPASADQVLYPFWHLQGSDLWEVADAESLKLTSNGRRPTLSTLNSLDPVAGFPQGAYELLSTNPEMAARVASHLMSTFFNPPPEGFLEDLGLADLMADRAVDALRPRVGESFPNRNAISDVYGGNRVMGITPLRDRVLSVYSDDEGPYQDAPINEIGWIGYTGDGLTGHQRMVSGNRSLQTYQQQQRALRYWHKPDGGQWHFESWVVVVQVRQRWGVGVDGLARREFVWVLAPVPSPLRNTWPADVLEALAEEDWSIQDDTEGIPAGDGGPAGDDGPAGDGGRSTDTSSTRDRYRRLAAAARRTADRRTRRSRLVEVERYYRSVTAREAVMLRSQDKCENRDCLGHPAERTDAGAAILEVDHVNPLARGGADTPESMIALCPNCHALKTRGRNRKRLQSVLLKTARLRHEEFMSETG
ncbi:HNH endonuclease [Streptomyces erythrochromogenes]|uniref:HNH endonuclease n=1 Tax=Streptomyces erythrochromogenes TaxID=285574 RepID=UPI0036B5926B